MTKKAEVNFETRKGRVFSHRKEFFENGNLHKEGTYSKSFGSWAWDIPMGVVRTYHENGKLLSEESYDEGGNLEGDSKFYDKKGNLEKVVTYSNDKIINETIHDIPTELNARYQKI